MYCQSEQERANVAALAHMYGLPLVTSSSDRQALVDQYANEHAPLLLDVVGAWMRPEVAPQFKQHHLVGDAVVLKGVLPSNMTLAVSLSPALHTLCT